MPSNRAEVKRPIVILTDFGGDGFYVGAMKGAILSVDPRALLVDLTHALTPFAVAQASFLLSRVLDLFPEGAVFLAVIDPGVGGRRRNLVVEAERRLIVAPDNGVVSDLARGGRLGRSFSIRARAAARVRAHRARGRTFLGRDVLGPVAAALGRGDSLSSLAEPCEGLRILDLPVVSVSRHRVRGSGRYVDPFGNILTDIGSEHVRRAFGERPLAKIRATIDNSHRVEGVRRYFAQVRKGDLAVLLDSWDLIEIAVREGRAADRFADASVTVELSAL